MYLCNWTPNKSANILNALQKRCSHDGLKTDLKKVSFRHLENVSWQNHMQQFANQWQSYIYIYVMYTPVIYVPNPCSQTDLT